MTSFLRLLALSALMLSAFVSIAAAQARAPAEVVDVFVRAWNAHDMQAFGAVVAQDADWVTVAGARLKGRAAIQGFLNEEHQGGRKQHP